MNSKQYIKKIIRYLLGKKPHSVGVFYNYSDIKKDDFWSSEFWKKQQKDALGLIGDWCFLPELSQTFLSVTVLKLNLLSKDKPISVLDYGGGADTPDYFTERKVEGGSHPYHILNLKELTKYMKSKGFQPEFRSSWAKEYIQEIDYDKVPKDYQIYCTSHMFFSTTSKNTKH